MRTQQQIIEMPGLHQSLLKLIMPAAVLLAGLAAGSAAQACISAADAEANGCINEVRVESPSMSVTGQSAYVQAGQAVTFTAQAFSGATSTTSRGPTPCDNGWDWKVYNSLGDVIDPASIVIENGTMSIAAANNPGIGRVQATCRDNPSITDEVSVIEGGGALGATRPANGPPAIFGQKTGTPSPVGGMSASAPPPPPVGGMSQGAKTGLIVGAVVGGTALLVGAAVAAADVTTDSGGGGGGGGWYADWSCSSSQCASVMGGYSGSTGPFSTQSACIAWTQSNIIAPCNYR